MTSLKIKGIGLALLGVGVYLFLLSVRDMAEGDGRTATGLLSVFGMAVGFGCLLIPGAPEGLSSGNLPSPSANDDS